MKSKLLLLLFSAVFIGGCKTTQQRVTYNTLSTTIVTVHQAYDAYLDLVVRGQVATNDVSKVSMYYDKFQNAANIAVSLSASSLTNLTALSISQAAGDTIQAISQAEAH